MPLLREVNVPVFSEFLFEANAKERAIMAGRAALIAPSDAMARSTDRGRKHAAHSDGSPQLTDLEDTAAEDGDLDYKNAGEEDEGDPQLDRVGEYAALPTGKEDADPNGYNGPAEPDAGDPQLQSADSSLAWFSLLAGIPDADPTGTVPGNKSAAQVAGV